MKYYLLIVLIILLTGCGSSEIRALRYHPGMTRAQFNQELKLSNPRAFLAVIRMGADGNTQSLYLQQRGHLNIYTQIWWANDGTVLAGSRSAH